MDTLELKKSFLEEASRLLADSDDWFLELKRSSSGSVGGDSLNIEKLFRLTHNLKGSARAVGFSQLATVAHRLESVFLKIKGREITLDRKVIDLLLRSNDVLRQMIEALHAHMEATFDTRSLEEELEKVLEMRDTHPI